MKKLVFTTIAMIAFSGASMASTGKVKKTTKVVKKETPTCYYGWIAVYQECGAAAADAWGSAHGC